MNSDPALLRRLLDATRAAIIATDAEGRVTYWSRHAEALYGHPASGALGRFIYDFMEAPPEVVGRSGAVMARLANGETWTGEFEVRRPDGSTVAVQVNDAPLFDEAGVFVGVVGVSVDISDRRAAHAALQREQALLRSIIDAAPVVLFATDLDGVFTISRGRGLGPAGIGEGEFVGRSAFEAYGTLPVSIGPVTITGGEALRRALDGESINGRIIINDVHFEMWLAPRYDAGRRIAGATGVALDITAQTMLEHRLNQAEKLEALGLLAGGVAHDFNNMLTAILGHAEILVADLDDARREDAEAIRHAAESAAAVTRQLLAFTRRQHQELRIIDVNQALRSFEPLLRSTVGQRVKLELALTTGRTTILADAAQVEQVILNLAINARDAMVQGGTLRIATAVVAEPDERGGQTEYVEIAVADTGHGISPAIRARIFEPFFTTKERARGTGLGLASVHGIVTQSGGRIFVESDEGVGTLFRVLLPIAAADPAAGALPVGPADRDASSARETILLVEDEEGVRRVAMTILVREGYRVIACATGQEALTRLRSERTAIDLVLTDVIMPGMSGPELAAEIAKELPSLPILFMSGYAAADAPASTVPADIPKPFSRTQLVAAIAQRLDRR